MADRHDDDPTTNPDAAEPQIQPTLGQESNEQFNPDGETIKPTSATAEHSPVEGKSPTAQKDTVHATHRDSSDASSIATIQHFGDYELLHEVARGGMGVVWKARHTKLNRTVALKMILSGQFASEQDVQRFYSEAESAAQLDHPGIVPIFEIGKHDGQHFFSMAFIEGENLQNKISEHPLSPKRAARYVRLIAEAVQFAHARNIIHRDLKPANILVDVDDQPKVTDFGLAKKLETESGVTVTGQVIGTPSYMAPEQASGKTREVGPLADVYALGAILYCLLTRQPPFRAATTMDTLLQVLEQEPAFPRQLNEAVDLDLQTIVLKCLEKAPDRRYASAQELADELGRYLRGEPIKARPVGRLQRTWRWCRRNPVVAALSALAAISLTAGTVISTAYAIENEKRATAEAEQRELAEEQKGIAQEAQKVTAQALSQSERSLSVANRRLYAASMQLAQNALNEHDLVSAQRLLDEPVPSSEVDLRDWEWYYLRSLCFGERITGRGHRGAVESVAWNPAKNIMASADSLGEIKLWDTHDATVLQQMQQSTPRAVVLDWNLSGDLLLGRPAPITFLEEDDTKQVYVWTSDGEERLSVAANAASWDAQGSKLAIATADHSLTVWQGNTNQRELLREFSKPLSAIDWNHRNNHIAVAVEDQIYVVAADSGKLVGSSQQLPANVTTLCWNPANPEQLAVALLDKSVLVWNVADQEKLTKLSGHNYPAWQLEWNSDGSRLLSTEGPYNSVNAIVWDVADEKLVRKYPAASAVWHPDGQRLATADEDGTTILVSRPDREEPLQILHGHTHNIYGLTWSTAGTDLASGAADRTIKIWDLDQPTQTQSGNVLSRSPHGQYLISTNGYGPDAKVSLHDASTGKELCVLAEGSLSRSAWSSSGEHLVLQLPTVRLADGTRREGSWKIWDCEAQRLLFSRKLELVRAVTWGPHEQTLALADLREPKVRIVNTGDGSEVATFDVEQRVTALRYTPDGRGIALECSEFDKRWTTRKIKIIDADSGEILQQWNSPQECISVFCEPVVSPDGTHIAWGTWNEQQRVGQVLVWPLKDGASTVARLSGFKRQVRAVGWSPEGQRLAAADGSELRLWSARSYLPLLRLDTSVFPNNIRWNPGKRKLVLDGNREQVFDATVGYQHAEQLPDEYYGMQLRPYVGGGFF